MQHKTVQLVNVKADEAGHFTALASVFGNVDSQGDRMMPGAFKRTLARWRKSGDPIPVILSHQWSDPMALIGKADPRAVMETDEGLVVQGTLDLENPVARQVRKLMVERLLKGWSFGYIVGKNGQRTADDGANEVTEVDLIEVGPTLKGANDQARLQDVKSALDQVRARALGPDEEEEDEEVVKAEPVAEPVAARLKRVDDTTIQVTLGGPVSEQELAARIKACLAEPAREEATEEAIEDEPAQEPVTPPAKSRLQDQLRADSRRQALEVLSDGLSLRKYEPEEPEPEPDVPTEDDQRRRFCDLYI